MKKFTTILMSLLILFGAIACDNTAKTSETAPEPNEAAQSPSVQTTEAARQDAESETRRRQLNADIRAREERNLGAGDETDRAAADLASEVRSKLEANLPDSQLTVNANKNGQVTVNGTVNNKAQLAKIAPLAKQIKGVKDVVVNAKVTSPQG
ncbi:MAG TPA: BON domain-containing protein [Nostocaceae cyanobacterium]|nr:BON domain-containing protein [Nostocaceae cyanobacterium]